MLPFMDMLVRETQMMRKIGRFGVRDRKAEVQMVEDFAKHDRSGRSEDCLPEEAGA